MRDDPSRNLFAWHGWQLALPRSWNPVKIEGDYDKGQVLFADLDHPRLGVRWQRIKSKSFDADAWAQKAMRDEVGQLAADEAVAGPSCFMFHVSRLYLDPKPPGRDVWIGHSTTSDRAIEMIYHARRRDRVLPDAIVPALLDTSGDDPMRWSIFDLACTTPPGFRLRSHRLNAGDLALTFAREREWITLRQIAVAHLSLARMPLDKWLADQQLAIARHYAPAGNLREFSIPASARELSGFARAAIRLKRFFFAYWLVPQVLTCVLHDKERDRLLMLQGTDESLIRPLTESSL